MADRKMTPLLAGGTFFEGPRWHDGRWWVSDFFRYGVFTVTTDGHEEKVMTVEGQPSGLGWMPDGSMLVVSMRDFLLLRRTAGGEVSVHADLAGYGSVTLNDMVVDSTGRAYVGNFGFDLGAGADPQTTCIARVDPDGSVSRAADDLFFPNGSVVTPDGGTLIVGETLGCRYTAFTIDDDGSLSDRRVWAQLAPTPPLGGFAETFAQVAVAPDGCALDADGHIWAADAVGRRCIRVTEGGAIVDEIAMPEGLGAFACMLGGEDGRTLLVCAAPGFDEEGRVAHHDAVLLTTEVEVPHAGLP